MIMTIKNADFSLANMGKINVYIISKLIGKGATYEIPGFVEKNKSAAWVITLDEGYLFGEYSITMDDVEVIPSLSGKTMTISIPEITGNIRILIETIDTSVISFSNDDFELGAYDAAGQKVELDSRYRTSYAKMFNKDVRITTNVLEGETQPAYVRQLIFTDNAIEKLYDWSTDITIPANTKFHLILRRSTGDKVSAAPVTVSVPTNATKLYVNTLISEKDASYIVHNGNVYKGSDFINGLYRYGTEGTAIGTLTSSTKMCSYENAISVKANDTVVFSIYCASTVGYVFTDDNDNVISINTTSQFPNKNYYPLDFFSYAAV